MSVSEQTPIQGDPREFVPDELPTAKAELEVIDVTVTDEELPARPSLAALGESLERIAERVHRRGDAVTNGSHVRVDAVTSFLGSVGTLSLVAFQVRNGIVPEVISVGLGASIRGIYTNVQAGKPSHLEIDDGYTIQCLRADARSDRFGKKEVVAFIHARSYDPGESQTRTQAQARLGDVLAVLEHAPTVSKAVVPTHLLREAGLRRTPGEPLPFGEALETLKPRTPCVSVQKRQLSTVMLSRSELKELSQALEAECGRRTLESQTVLNSILDAVAERFNLHVRVQEAAEDPERLVAFLHGLLPKALEGELPTVRNIASKRKQIDGPQDEAELLSLINGGKESVIFHVDSKDQFNPLIIQRRPNFTPLESHRLLALVGGVDQLLADLAVRLQTRGYSNLQLVSLALYMLGKTLEEKAALTADSNIPEVPELPGDRPVVIRAGELRPGQRIFWNYLGRSAVRLAAASLAGSLLIQGIGLGKDVIKSEIGTHAASTSANQDDIIWEVDEHGLSSVGHYAQTTYNHYDAARVTWDGKAPRAFVFDDIPLRIMNETRPNLVIHGITDASNIDLPILEGTQLVALEASTQSGQVLSTTIEERVDHTIDVQVSNGDAPYQLTYEVARVDWGGGQARAYTTPTITDAVPPQPMGVPGADSVLTAGSYIQTHFTYDAGNALRDKLLQQHTVNDYLQTIYSGGRCDCVECTTAAILANYQATGQAPQFLPVSGYWQQHPSPDNQGVSYLYAAEEHAWVTDQDAHVLDFVASRQDANSHVPEEGTTAELASQVDKAWQHVVSPADDSSVTAASGDDTAHTKTTDRPAATASSDVKADLHGVQKGLEAGGVFLGLLGLWRLTTSRRLLRTARGVVRTGRFALAHAVIPEEMADSVMAWYAYSNHDRPFQYVPDRATPIIDNIGNDKLHEIADGSLKEHDILRWYERLGVQAMAKVELLERRDSYTPKHSSAKKV
ncbi:MAG TPA: hypothetical protein VLF91_05645 [Candidatus Saccharimonadales bacterium]|nr:hypothetical protein [Candidatus Saccharimonadales bacterium]